MLVCPKMSIFRTPDRQGSGARLLMGPFDLAPRPSAFTVADDP